MRVEMGEGENNKLQEDVREVLHFCISALDTLEALGCDAGLHDGDEGLGNVDVEAGIILTLISPKLEGGIAVSTLHGRGKSEVTYCLIDVYKSVAPSGSTHTRSVGSLPDLCFMAIPTFMSSCG